MFSPSQLGHAEHGPLATKLHSGFPNGPKDVGKRIRRERGLSHDGGTCY